MNKTKKSEEMQQTLLSLIQSRPFFLDGGTGTVLQASGMRPGETAEEFVKREPNIMESLHRAYIAAGADAITAATFGVNPLKCDGCEEKIAFAVNLAKKAASGTIPVLLDVGPTGRILKPYGETDFETVVSAFSAVMRAGEAAGADAVLIETLSDLYEAKAALLAARESTSLPVIVSFSFGADGRLMTGGTPEAAVALAEAYGAIAVGVNCSSGPRELVGTVARMCRHASIPVSVMPNAGLPEMTANGVAYNVSPEEFASCMREMLAVGASLIGGCCGTTPAYIAEVYRLCKDIRPLRISEKNESVVTSGSRAVYFGDSTVLIGERLNPTGKKALKEALRRSDMDYCLRIAIDEENDGADLLDVNVGLPDIDEKQLLSRLVYEIQGVSPLPLCIDTADPAAMENALRLYNGRPLLNSVNGKRNSMDAVFPLAKKYGAMLVALTLDENGIPATAEGRVAIAEKILNEGKKYGFSAKDFLFDTLTMTVATDPDAAQVTLQALREIRRRLGAHTSLGVSNVSFGLPERDSVNSIFFAEALSNGLSAAIMNPASAAMQRTLAAHRLLSGKDADCRGYIEAIEKTKNAVLPTSTLPKEAKEKNTADERDGTPPLIYAILHGMENEAARAAEAACTEGATPLSVLQSLVVPALDRVGKRYEEGSLFLPQLLLAAEAAKAAFRILSEKMPESTAAKGKVLLATVKGDVHDIGKNIVKAVLESYGYRVYDLGRDVSPEEILKEASEKDIRLVGLSALMTTTVPAMRDTVSLLRTHLPQVRVMVGGAVLTRHAADEMGADFYCKDAMEAVRVADGIFSD